MFKAHSSLNRKLAGAFTSIALAFCGAASAQHTIDLTNGIEGFEIAGFDNTTDAVRFTQAYHNALGTGDLNGDGFDDLVIGAAGRLEPAYLIPLAGEVLIKFGPTPTCGQANLNNPLDVDVHIIGSDDEDLLGWSVKVADLTGDGQDDLLVASYLADGAGNSAPDVGAVYAFFGPLAAGTLDVEIDADWTLHGDDSLHPIGKDLAVGDLSGDGIPDLAVGAPGVPEIDLTALGATHVIFGPFTAGTRDLATQPAETLLVASGARERLGYALEIADLNQDGTQDLVAGAPGASGILIGEVYTFFGPLSSGTTLDHTDADVTVSGLRNVENFGRSLGVADLDGDGFDDLAMGTSSLINPELGDRAGGVSVLYSPFSTGTVLKEDETDLLVYTSTIGQMFSMNVGDVSGDGQADLIMTSPVKDPHNTQNVDGEVEIVFGPLGTGVKNLALDPADVRILGHDGGNGQLGRAAAIADLSGDGDPDLALTASFLWAPGSSGRAFILDSPIGFIVDSDTPPACVASSPLTLAGSADSDYAVDSVEAWVNGTLAGTACTNCGIDPSFSFDFPLQACDNTLRYRATDAEGHIGVETRKTRLDADGPIFSGCTDIELEVAEGVTGAVVTYGPGASDGCDGDLPSNCSIPSGSFFGLGVTEVSCTSTDTCGNASTCDFRVIVEVETQGNTECREDDFSDPLSAIWTLDTLGDAGMENAAVVGGELHLTGTGSSLYHGPADNAAFLHQSVTGDFFIETEVTSVPLDAGDQYRKGGVIVRDDLSADAARVMAQVVPHFPQGSGDTIAIQFDYRDEQGNAYELASTVQNVTLPVRVGIARRGDELTVYWSAPGQPWVKPAGAAGGSVTLSMADTVLAGLDAASYDLNQPFTMAFDNVSLCTPNDIDSGPVQVGCDDSRAIDVVYMMDMSGSMARPFDGTSKLVAARQAIHRLNDTFGTLTDGSRGALITYSLANGSTDPNAATTVVSSFTTDFAALSAAVDGIDFNAVLPLDASPTASALAAAEQLLQTAGDPAHRPILVWLTDNLPNVDDQLNGALYYEESEIRGLSILDGMGGYLPRGEVAWLGNENSVPSGDLLYDGEVLADAMAGIESLMESFPETRILSAVPRDGAPLPTIPEELLDYAAFWSDGGVYGGAGLDSLIDAMSGLLADAYCGLAGNASVAGQIWRDLNADGVNDSGENGVYGVTVELLDSSQNVLASAVTGSSGRYSFISIPPAAVEIRIDGASLPSELTIPTYDRDGVGTVDSFSVTLASYDAITDGDFGYAETVPNVQPLSACFDDDFADGLLEADWRSTYLGNADQGTVDESSGTLKLSGDGTTLFGTSDNGHYLYRHVNGDFRAELDILDFPVDQGGAYRKAGLMVLDGFGDSERRVMVQYVPHWAGGASPALQFSYRSVAGASDSSLASNVNNIPLPVRVAIERQGNTFSVYYSTDGGANWTQPGGGSVSFAMDAIVSVGMDAVSYDTDLTLTAEMDDFSLCPASP